MGQQERSWWAVGEWVCGAFQPGPVAYRCSLDFGHRGPHRAELDGEVLAEWERRRV